MADKNQQIAQGILEAVGGQENVSMVLHCLTRLRLHVKDEGLVDDAAVRRVPRVIGTQWSGGFYQVIIGQQVTKVYQCMVAVGVTSNELFRGDDKQPCRSRSLNPVRVGEAICTYMANSVAPLLPVLMVAGIFKVLSTVLAPGMLGLVPADHDLITLCNVLYEAAFYFMPIYLGSQAARQLGATPALGAYLGGVLIAPTIVQLAAQGATLDVFGIPCIVRNYASSSIPILLSVWVMSNLERFLRRRVPEVLSTVFVPLITMLVMTPVTLCALAPLGSWLGALISGALLSFRTLGGPFVVLGGGIIAALWLPLVMTGMHTSIIALSFDSFATTGSDYFALVAIALSVWATYGTELGAALRIKDLEDRAYAWNCFVTNTLGGVAEPFIFGILFKYPRLWLMRAAGAFACGSLAMLLHVGYFNTHTASVLNLIAFVGDDSRNVVNAAVCAAVGFAVSLGATWVFGVGEEVTNLPDAQGEPAASALHAGDGLPSPEELW